MPTRVAGLKTRFAGRVRGFQTYPGLDGIPHRSRGPFPFREGDPERLRPQPAGRVRCEVFDLALPEQQKRYQLVASIVYTLAQQGRGAISSVDRRFDEQTKCWRVYLEWIELFTYDGLSAQRREFGRGRQP